MNLTTEFKVGVFALVAGGLLTYFVLRTNDRRVGLFKEPVLLSAIVDNVEGVQKGTAVEIAGVAVGNVKSIKLSDDERAVVTLEIEPEYQLPEDTQLAMKTRGLLGDRFIQLIPGTSDATLGNGGQITHIKKGLDVDALTAKGEVIADDVAGITKNLNDLLGKPETKERVEKILANLETLSTQLPQTVTRTEGDIDRIAGEVEKLTAQMQTLVQNANAILTRTGEGLDSQMASLDTLTTKLQSSIDSVNAITAKVESGEGTVGALLNDRKILDQIEGTVGDVQDLVNTVGRIQAEIAYHGEFFATGSDAYKGDMRNAFEVSLRPREDYGYLVEIVSDPVGDRSVETVTYDGTYYDGTDVVEGESQTFTQVRVVDDYLYTLQLMRRWNNVQGRIGVKYNTGGVGADLYFLNDRLTFRADLFRFQAGQYPNLKLKAELSFLHALYFGVGVDDTLNGVDQLARGYDSLRGVPGQPAVFLGGGFRFVDDDIKLLMTLLPF